jgi:hypothetical protein
MNTITATPVRAGDREREITAGQLGLALSQGYLDMPEYERRVGAAFAAQTSGELHALVADLPVGRLRMNDPRRREARNAAARMSVRLHLAAYVLMVVIVLTVWTAITLTSGPTYFWPVWPILGAGIGVLGHAIPIRMCTVRR